MQKLNRFHVLTVGLCFLIFFVQGLDNTGITVAVSAILRAFHAQRSDMGITFGAAFSGFLLGSLVFGFFTDRFSATTAGSILDIFKPGSAHPAFVLGSGAWWWNEGTDATWTAAWQGIVYRMGAWQPWNVGNAGGSIAEPKNYIPSVGWVAQIHDSEGNRVGLHDAI